MNDALRHAARLFRSYLLAPGTCTLGIALVGAGCSAMPSTYSARSAVATRAVRPASPYAAAPAAAQAAPADEPAIVQVQAREAAELPPAAPEQAPAPAVPPPAPAPAPAAPQVVPIGLDTVFRLAEEQNPQVGVARERLREACAEQDVANRKWLPDLYAGTAFYRHEGGIQNEDGTLTHSSFGSVFGGLELNGQFDVREIAFHIVSARRNVWQQRGELSRQSSETLLNASTTYIDLLAARTGEAVALRLQKDLDEILARARSFASADLPGAKAQLASVEAEVANQRRALRGLQEQAVAASAKLAYLLGIEGCTELAPVDPKLVPIELVDASPSCCDLAARALANGPGIREMEGLLALIQESMERSQGPGKYLPVFQVRMAEGAFGAGPGDSLTWDNRWDLGVQARWNLTELVTARDRQRAAEAKVQQAYLTYQDLRNKLTAGVQEAKEAVQSGQAQMRDAQTQIDKANEVYDISFSRYKEGGVQGATANEVLLALDARARAQLNYLNAVSAYDKAQLRLMVLLGPNSVIHGPGHCN